MLNINDQIHRIEANIYRRRKELADDLNNTVLVENRFVSEKLSSIQGMKEHINKSNKTKALYSQQEVPDQWAHGTVSRLSLHHK